MTRTTALTLCAVVCLARAAAAQPPAPADLTLAAPDGAKLKATYYAAAKPGPGVLLLHQCNQDRRSWAAFAKEAASRGYHVLTLDYRGFGESEGARFTTFQEQQPIIEQKWPGDIDAAFGWLTSQPGVDRQRIAAAGASCGVNQAVLAASRHPEVRTVMLLSGGITPAARTHLRTAAMPVFVAASHDDGGIVEAMRWTLGWSAYPRNRMMEFKAAGHGTEMFAVEKELQPAMLSWLDEHLRKAPDRATAAEPPSPTTAALVEFWDVIARPDGRTRAKAIVEDTRRRDPRFILFPEAELNAFAYQVLQGGDAEHAIWLFEMNVEAYPKSANTYDSLSDAYLAAGKRDEALRYAEKALEVLKSDTQAPEEFKALVRDSAERKVRELRGKGTP
jgi:dienelactone hydrolase